VERLYSGITDTPVLGAGYCRVGPFTKPVCADQAERSPAEKLILNGQD